MLAGDSSRWNRPCAKCLKDRTFAGGNQSAVTVGQSYSSLAWIPEERGSWALPLRHERITSFETPTSRAAFQLKQVTRPLDVRPLAFYDRGYGNASFVNQTQGIEADLLLRLASNRCVYGVPPAYKGRGAPAKHGHKLKLNAPQTWSLPTEIVEVDDPKLGRVRVTRWSAYHFRKSPKRPMEIIRVEVLEPKDGKRRQIDAHWKRGMSYLKLGWNWIRLAITQQWKIRVYQFLSCVPDPHPAIASRRQHEDALKREFTVLSRIPAS